MKILPPSIQRKKGHNLTTGRFSTRNELSEKVMFLRQGSSRSIAQIARQCEVSRGMVETIIQENSKSAL